MKDLKSNSNPDIKIFLIGNKSDLEDKREVSKDEAIRFKNDYDLDLFMETSAKNGMNAKELFAEAAKVLFKDYSKYKIIKSQKGEILKIEDNDNKKEEKSYTKRVIIYLNKLTRQKLDMAKQRQLIYDQEKIIVNLL